MSDDLETFIPGVPGSIEAVAEWLRVTLRDKAADHADTTYAQRNESGSAWEGEAGEAFGSRLSTLASASDDVSAAAVTQGQSLDTLAAALRSAQSEAGRARTHASGGGLTVSGMTVINPGPGPSRPIAPSADAPQPLIDAHNERVETYDEHQLKVTCWNETVEIAQGAFDDWDEALVSAGERWQSNAGNLASLTQGFLAAGLGGASAAARASRFHGKANLHRSNISSLRGHVGALTNPDGTTRGSSTRINQLLDEIDDAKIKAADAHASGMTAKPSAGVSKLLNRLGYAAAIYGTYDDYANGGESLPQAVTSNAGGLVAGMVAGAYIGGAIGTAIPVPILGTAVGALSGALIGAGVGIFTSGMIDSLWENGVDGLEDVGGAIVDGGKEVVDTVKDVGGLAKDGWNAVFG
ncbi:hypothetical protein [Aeromicrobium stalagmiti]|uniref:hypothetical protein n=1 Tax=Aeromicrobium stalagmiti TaxID=2738988 RepID=UPI0015697DE2|nr:hypothetical protein [Aeromicrobium stalagmiti]NRQ49488.1 hypothetical protein [Aeromicrobium stalagmiti]